MTEAGFVVWRETMVAVGCSIVATVEADLVGWWRIVATALVGF